MLYLCVSKSIVMKPKKYNYDESVELSTTNEPTSRSREQRILQPDDKLRRAITGEELQARIFKDLETFFADKK